MLRVIEVCNVCIEVIKTNEENSSVHSFIKMDTEYCKRLPVTVCQD